MRNRRFPGRRWLFRGLAAGLVALHAVLLVRRVTSPEGLADPEALLRWLGSALLLGGALAWRRWSRRHGWVRPGRGMLVFWTVAALLHAGVGVQPVEIQAEAASGLLWMLAAWGFLAAILHSSPPRRVDPRVACPLSPLSGCSDPARGARCAPRPPPFALAS